MVPHLLSAELAERIAQAKLKAVERRSVEAEIPSHLLYTKDWPTTMPSMAEAEVIASVRTRVSELPNLDAQHLSAATVRARYEKLIELR